MISLLESYHSHTAQTTCPPVPELNCTLPTSVAVTFNVNVTTLREQAVELIGNNAVLGNWNPPDAVTLSAGLYVTTSQLLSVKMKFSPREVIQYKYIKVQKSGNTTSVTWENGANRNYKVPATCATAVAVSDIWKWGRSLTSLTN